MSQNYQRYFLVLSENSPEFTVRGKKALGKCILESKGGTGKVSFSVQNLKPGVICSAYIISAGDNGSTAIEIGRIIPDDKGRAEIKWECNSMDVENSGLELKSFNVAGMMAIKDGIVNAPLVGYKDGEILWKNNIKIHSKKPIHAEPDKSVASVPAETEEKNTATEAMQNTGSDDPVQDDGEALPEDFFETVEEGAAEKTFKHMAQKINEKLSEIDGATLEGAYDAEAENPIRAMSESEVSDMNMIFRNASKIRPFKDVDEHMEWVRITPNELDYAPEELKYLHKDYTISVAYRKFGHLVLGRKLGEDGTSVVFGMPDIYTKRNEKTAELSGLTVFQCCDCGDILEGKHGYWLKEAAYASLDETFEK